ncbi:MAG: pyridoxal phosphate-dependent class II aminotransferase [Bacteroides sp.]|nr:pyridoxal phosphate-dependent class II aminotransferase [Bacteroides sp.]
MIKGHGDDIYRYPRSITVNFSSNVFGRLDVSGLKKHLCECMDLIGSYPEPEPYTLEAALAEKHHLQADEVCVTNGATEAIYLIAQTFHGTHSAIVQPTFSEYADACRMHGHRVSVLYQLPTEQEGYRLSSDIRMLWLCNPNNPTGCVVEKRTLDALIRHNPQVCFVIDQSYEFFTLCPLFSSDEVVIYTNVLLLHSMTKRYAIPGLRLGYVTGNASLLGRLRTHRMPWSVNRLAVCAGIYLMEHPEEAFMDVSAYLEETRRLKERLQTLGTVEVWETETHFMLACLRFGKASALKDYLAEEHGILIRDASNFEGLDDRFFRIATQTPEENDRLVEAIKMWLEL